MFIYSDSGLIKITQESYLKRVKEQIAKNLEGKFEEEFSNNLAADIIQNIIVPMQFDTNNVFVLCGKNIFREICIEDSTVFVKETVELSSIMPKYNGEVFDEIKDVFSLKLKNIVLTHKVYPKGLVCKQGKEFVAKGLDFSFEEIVTKVFCSDFKVDLIKSISNNLVEKYLSKSLFLITFAEQGKYYKVKEDYVIEEVDLSAQFIENLLMENMLDFPSMRKVMKSASILIHNMFIYGIPVETTELHAIGCDENGNCIFLINYHGYDFYWMQSLKIWVTKVQAISIYETRAKKPFSWYYHKKDDSEEFRMHSHPIKGLDDTPVGEYFREYSCDNNDYSFSYSEYTDWDKHEIRFSRSKTEIDEKSVLLTHLILDESIIMRIF